MDKNFFDQLKRSVSLLGSVVIKNAHLNAHGLKQCNN
jgi:hypothetical protein